VQGKELIACRRHKQGSMCHVAKIQIYAREIFSTRAILRNILPIICQTTCVVLSTVGRNETGRMGDRDKRRWRDRKSLFKRSFVFIVQRFPIGFTITPTNPSPSFQPPPPLNPPHTNQWGVLYNVIQRLFNEDLPRSNIFLWIGWTYT
jgi:hypothetical protein